MAPSDPVSLPESTTNPSLPYFSDDYGSPVGSALYAAPSLRKGDDEGNNRQKKRIPMERRYVLGRHVVLLATKSLQILCQYL